MSLFFVVFLVVTTFILFNVITSFLFDAYGIQCEVVKEKKRHAQHRAMQRNVPLDGLDKNDETTGLLQVRLVPTTRSTRTSRCACNVCAALGTWYLYSSTIARITFHGLTNECLMCYRNPAPVPHSLPCRRRRRRLRLPFPFLAYSRTWPRMCGRSFIGSLLGKSSAQR